MDVRIGQPGKNLAKVEELAARASQSGSNFLLLPELWSTGYDLEHADQHAARIDSGVFASVSTLAQKYKLAILGSCLSLVGPGLYANTAVLFDDNGRIIADYNKIHLFKLMDEPQYLMPGNKPVVADTEWGKAGVAICYDLRFPELFRYYALQGASMVMIPAEWPWPRLSHWRTLLQARAIENQLFIFACNRVGTSKRSTFFGHSMIIDPWGEIVIEGGEDEELITAVIDLGQVKSVRTTIPVFEDRRPDIYGLEPEQI
jgi:predicted amidohydrolase